MKSRSVLFSAFILLGMLNGCASATQIDATVASTPTTVQVQVNTPAPTQSPNPTSPPLATPVPSPTSTPLPTLAVGERNLTYEIRNNTLTLHIPEATQRLTFSSDILQVKVVGEDIRVTLADGAEKTLTWDQETGRWQEMQAFRPLTELDPSKEEEMQVIKKAVADTLAGGAFWDETEIKEKIEAGELKVVRDEKTGAIMVFTQQALEYMKEKGQSVADSDFARILHQADPTTPEQYQEWVDGDKLKEKAGQLLRFGYFLPLPQKYMTLVPRVDDSKPYLTAVLPKRMVAKGVGTNHYFILGQPSTRPKDLEALYSGSGTVLGLDVRLDEGEAQVQKLNAPYSPVYRYMGEVFEGGDLRLADEYQTVTHEWDEATGQWRELDEYRVYGEPAERMAYALNYKLNEVRYADTYHENPLGLNPEIVAEAVKMLKEGKPVKEINQELMRLYEEKQKEDPKSSGIWLVAGADGEPYMVAVVGGEYGLNPLQFQAVIKAAQRLEEIDPGILKLLSEQFGAKFITYEYSLNAFTYGQGSSNDRGSVIFQSKLIDKRNITPEYMMDVILGEAAELACGRTLSSVDGRFNGRCEDYPNVGLFAADFEQKWLDEHRHLLTPSEVDSIEGGIRGLLEVYGDVNN